MDAWTRFLKQLKNQQQVFIVGPMYAKPYSAQAPTIFVDGGADFREEGDEDGNIPAVMVGDGDSAQHTMDVELPRQKNYTDLAFVLRNLPASIRYVELLGFRGGRLDHELVNFGEANKFLSGRKIFTSVRFDQSVVGFAGGALRVDIQGEFSVLVLETAEITVTGACQYPLAKATKLERCSGVGLSNVGKGEVIINCSKPAFLFTL